MTETRVVIIGGGFGGLYAALELEKVLKRRDDVAVTSSASTSPLEWSSRVTV